MGLEIKNLNDAIQVTKDEGTKVAYYLFDEYEIHLNTIHPGTIQAWHYHQAIEEIILVTKGKMEVHYLQNGQQLQQIVKVNDLVLVKDSIHTFVNSGAQECQFIVFRLVLEGKNKREIFKHDKTEVPEGVIVNKE